VGKKAKGAKPDAKAGGGSAKADFRANQTQVRIAQLCGRELMFADSVVPNWSWPDVLVNKGEGPTDLWYKDVISRMYFVFGKTMTGKSFWTRDALYHMRNIFAYGWCFTHTKVRRCAPPSSPC
jgi:hypothetical protein